MTKAVSLPLIASITFLTLGITGPVQAQQSMTFFVTSVGLGKGGDLGGLGGGRPPLPELCPSRWRGQQDVARLSLDAGFGRGQRQGPHWQRSVVQRQRHANRGERRRPARRQQQDQQGDSARRKGDDSQGSR